MKYLLLVVVLSTFISSCLCQQQGAKLRKSHTECVEESKVDPSLITASRWRDAGNNSKFREYLICFNRKMGCIGEDGRLNKDGLINFIPAHVSNKEEIANKCAVQKQTLQESVFEAMKCIEDNIGH